MSIVLKGIDMPKEGEHIVALIKSNGKYSYWKQDAEYGIYEPMQTFEAIQIPTPHGRLIDGDEMIKKYILTEVMPYECMTTATTIIEAEE